MMALFWYTHMLSSGDHCWSPWATAKMPWGVPQGPSPPHKLRPFLCHYWTTVSWGHRLEGCLIMFVSCMAHTSTRVPFPLYSQLLRWNSSFKWELLWYLANLGSVLRNMSSFPTQVCFSCDCHVTFMWLSCTKRCWSIMYDVTVYHVDTCLSCACISCDLLLLSSSVFSDCWHKWTCSWSTLQWGMWECRSSLHE